MRRPDAQPVAPSPIAERIRAVENRLIPSVRIKGRPLGAMRLAARMKKYHAQGVVIAVINDYAIEWTKGYGLADAAAGTPADSGTLFQAGGISQPVAAAVVLGLARGKKLDLDRDVNRSLKSWKIPKNAFTKGRPVTVRALLAHSAGFLPTPAVGYATGAPLPTLAQILTGTAPARTPAIVPHQPPGQDVRVSASSYVVLQQLLQDVTRRTFAELATEMVLSPLGMTRSTFEQPPKGAATAWAAAGHDATGRPIPGKRRLYPAYAALGLWTTAADVARLALDIQLASTGRSSKVFTPETARQMLTAEHVGWPGLGVMLAGRDASTRFGASGVTEGFESEMVAYVHRGQGAVVLTNTMGGGALAAEILNAIATVYGWPDYVPPEKVIARVDPRVYDRFVGKYQSEGRTVSIAKRRNRLFVGAPAKESVELLPESVSDFFAADSEEAYSFVFDENGKVQALTLRRRDEHSRWDRTYTSVPSPGR